MKTQNKRLALYGALAAAAAVVIWLYLRARAAQPARNSDTVSYIVPMGGGGGVYSLVPGAAATGSLGEPLTPAQPDNPRLDPGPNGPIGGFVPPDYTPGGVSGLGGITSRPAGPLSPTPQPREEVTPVMPIGQSARTARPAAPLMLRHITAGSTYALN